VPRPIYAGFFLKSTSASANYIAYKHDNEQTVPNIACQILFMMTKPNIPGKIDSLLELPTLAKYYKKSLNR